MTVAAPTRPDSAVPRSRPDRRTLHDAAAIGMALLATVPVIAPLARPGMAATHDGFLHVQRLIALDAVAREGVPFARWLPNLAYGYGQPLLLYYAPLSYLPALVGRLLGSGFATSIELAGGLAVLLSTLAMYALARSLFGPLAAMVAAAVYGTLPYQMVDLYVRGALAESWAFVWQPLIALCLLRCWTDGRVRWSAALALTVAGLILTHNVTALLFLPALAVLGLILLIGRAPAGRNAILHTLLGLGGGLALSAWFWLPAVGERHLVQIGETIEPELFASFLLTGWPPFRFDAIFDYQQPVSSAFGYPIFWPQVGLIQAIVSIAGGVAAWKVSGLKRCVAIWAIILVVGGIVAQLRPLAPLYDLIPLLAFVQFPWRLLAVIGLGSAILAGVLVEAVPGHPVVRFALAAAVVAASVTTAVLGLDPETTPIDERHLSLETLARDDLADWGLGTTHSGEYLPVSSGQRNSARLRKTILDATDSSSGRRSAEPIGFEVHGIEWRPDRIIADVTATSADRLVFHQFAFDGWRATVDGETVRAMAVGQMGLLAVNVPEGRHTVELVWSSAKTALRTLGLRVSIAAMLLLALLPLATRLRSRRGALILFGAALTVGVLAVDASDWALPAPGRPAQSASARWEIVDDALALVDVRHDASRLASDRLLSTQLTWLARQAPATSFRAVVETVAADGTVHRAPWIYEPLSRVWERGELLPTTVVTRLPADFPSGPAELRLTFERPNGLAPVALGRLEIPASRAAATPSRSEAEIEVGPGLRLSLVGASEASGALEARAGRPFDLTLLWVATGLGPAVDQELLVVAALAGPDGEIPPVAGRPGDWSSPLPFWQNGDVIEQRLRLNLPSMLAPGRYPVNVRVYGRDLAAGGAAEPGASSARPRGRPIAELAVGDLTVTP